MKPIAVSQASEVAPARAINGQRAGSTQSPADPQPPVASDQPMVHRSQSADAGKAAPVAHDRVAEIRDAIRSGKYPLLPVQVADAMIAARLLLVATDSKA